MFFAIALLLSGQRLTLKAQSSPWSHFALAQGGPVRWGQTVVYDPGSNSLILFGDFIGSPCCTSLNNTWVLRNANGLGGVPQQWQQLSPAGTLPPGRINQSAVYDQTHNRMIIFGGGQGNNEQYPVRFNDVWVLSNANGLGGTPTWTELNPSAPGGLPMPREGPEAVYDPNTNRMTIFGGGNNGIMDVPNDVWVLTNANGLGGQAEWIQLLPTGNLPAPREQFAAAYDPATNVMTIFGGCCGSLNDVWVLSHANGLGGTPAWQQVSPTGTAPAPRGTYDEFGYDPSTNSLIIFGGLGFNPEGTEYNDTWLLTNEDNIGGTPAWVNTIPNGSAGSPPPSTPSGAYDAVSKRLMVLPDPTDLWVMTTRNGVDFSGANSPTPTQLSQMAREGIQYAVGEISAGTSANSASVAELQAFQNAGFQTAAYCFIALDAIAAPGDQQVSAGITAMGGVGSATFNSVSFIAIDVEEESLLANGTYNPATLPARLAIIAEALQQITSSGKKAVIYTNQTAWHKAASDAVCNQDAGQTVCGFGGSGDAQAYALWEFTSYNRFSDSSGRSHCGDGIPSLTPFTAFDGWSIAPGKQYDIGVRTKSGCTGAQLSGLQVDFDVFDPTLFQ
jgi:hypothetical protein